MSRKPEKENRCRDMIKRSAKDKASSLIATYYEGRTDGAKTRIPLANRFLIANKNDSSKAQPEPNKGLKTVDMVKTGGAKKKQKTEIPNGTITITVHDKHNPIKMPPKSKQLDTTSAEYGFDMIEGDSDAGEYVVVKMNRPKPPIWGQEETRRPLLVEQTKVPIAVIDTFFGCQAENVDLREIFPRISKQQLKRRASSANWNTPPRYSTLPKY